MTVLELLDEIEDIVEKAPGLPLTGKIMVDTNELLNIVNEIRLGLPDDVQQAKWVKDEKERILTEAKEEYEKIIVEAKKQADYLVNTDDITVQAQNLADEIKEDAESYVTDLKMRTYDYMDKMLYEMQANMENIYNKHFGAMYSSVEDSFSHVNNIIESNRDELKQMAYRTQAGEDLKFQNQGIDTEEV